MATAGGFRGIPAIPCRKERGFVANRYAENGDTILFTILKRLISCSRVTHSAGEDLDICIEPFVKLAKLPLWLRPAARWMMENRYRFRPVHLKGASTLSQELGGVLATFRN